MLRFLHTSDWQMGMRYTHVGEKGERLRRARLEAVRRLVQVANEQAVDFTLVAGDLFENNQVEPLLVQQVADELAQARRPVYLISGNHDPLTPSSVYRQNAWHRVEQVHILGQAEPVNILPEVWLYPCPLFEKYGRTDPTSWIQPPHSGDKPSVRIGLAHGSHRSRGDLQLEDDFPIAADAASRSGLDYLALGHWHSTYLWKDAAGAVRTAYSGTQETTKFGESNSGHVLLVELAGPGAAPQITPLPVGRFRWEQWKRSLQGWVDWEQLLREVDALPEPAETLLDLYLEGLLPFSLYRQVQSDLDALLKSRLFYARLEASGVKLQPTEEELRAVAPSGILHETIEQLLLWSKLEEGAAYSDLEGTAGQGAQRSLGQEAGQRPASDTARQSLFLLYEWMRREGVIQ